MRMLKLQTLHLMRGPDVGNARMAPHAGQKSGSTINICSRLPSSMMEELETDAGLLWCAGNSELSYRVLLLSWGASGASW